jgi:hypothetical protein
MNKKQHLPQKVCPVCSRPFTWRKKWTRDWDSVTYCSERCRRRKNQEKNTSTEKIPLFFLFFFVRSFGLLDDCGQRETWFPTTV